MPNNLPEGAVYKDRSTSVIPTKPVLVSFDAAYGHLMGWEDPHLSGAITTDAGGLTRYGISENAFPSLNIRELTALRAKEITELNYWQYTAWNISKLPYTNLNQRLANKLLQFGFNTGVGTVIQLANLFLMIIQDSNVMPKLGDHLDVLSVTPAENLSLLSMLAAAQVSRYAKDYHFISKIPHMLMDRAVDIA